MSAVLVNAQNDIDYNRVINQVSFL